MGDVIDINNIKDLAREEAVTAIIECSKSFREILVAAENVMENDHSETDFLAVSKLILDLYAAFTRNT